MCYRDCTHNIFLMRDAQVLDSDKSGGLESAEFCAAIKKLVFLHLYIHVCIIKVRFIRAFVFNIKRASLSLWKLRKRDWQCLVVLGVGSLFDDGSGL